MKMEHGLVCISRALALAALVAGVDAHPAEAQGAKQAGDAKPLTLAFIPQENPEKLLGDIKVVSAYLAKELGRPVKGFVTLDHAAAVEALRYGDADITFMGGLPYVLAHAQSGAEVLLRELRRGKPYYTGRIFVRRDSGIRRIEDLEGKAIAFSGPISESGFLYPLEIFVKKGLIKPGEDPQKFFSRVYFAGGYQQAIQAMANGLVDAAGVSQYSDELLTPGQQPQVTWIAESERIPSHTVVARKGLDPAVKEAFAKALMKLNRPELRYMLKHLYGPEGYVRATHKDYESIERLARQHGILK